MEYRYTYEEVLDKINNARRFGNLPGVEVTGAMLEKLGHPESGMPFVHVAGTNGKGSVCAFLSSILKAAGKKVGTFTSPHLIDFRERIAINGILIPQEEAHRLGNLLLETEFGVEPTMFDYCLAMALLYFKEQGCDILVIETGLGGRLDSTNAIGTPEAAVITRIGFDHMSILGDTIEQIASEKAGIIKPGCPLVMERQETKAEKVIIRQFLQVNEKVAGAEKKITVVSEADIAQIRDISLKMIGTYQLENGAAAMLAARLLLAGGKTNCPAGETLNQAGEKTSSAAGETLGRADGKINCIIRQGLEQAVWPGRMEILRETPFLMADGAHNGHGVRALSDSLKELYPKEKFHFIMGVMADKDYENMIGELLPIATDFITYTPDSSRALQGRKLAECIRKYGVPAEEKNDLKEVIASLHRDGKNVAFGSLYFIGDLKNYVAHL